MIIFGWWATGEIRVIRFIVRHDHRYTVEALSQGDFGAPLPVCSALSYEDLFQAESLPPATYIFCDIERLSDVELVLAAEIYCTIAGADGFRVLNNPARVRTRYALLRALRKAGINDFDAYRADGFPEPERFPVFLRAESAHDTPVSDLLANQAALDAVLQGLPSTSVPLRGLIAIEYCAEPVREGVWRRYATFKVGDEVMLDHVVTDDSWSVKYGKFGLVDEETYRNDHENVVLSCWSKELGDAFDIASIDYGRADFGIVAGRPQIYEINTNPGLSAIERHRSPTRMRTMKLAQERFAASLFKIDSPGTGSRVALDGPLAWEARHVGVVDKAQTPQKASWFRRWRHQK